MLSLRGLVPADSGIYTCNVSNPYGWINHTYRVDVHGKGKVLRYLVTFTGITFGLQPARFVFSPCVLSTDLKRCALAGKKFLTSN